ncbi:MAG TPA: ABC transporter permease, partial [Microlunatus sp.]|nr:ABC transporter permease [Microlunatus sp.]
MSGLAVAPGALQDRRGSLLSDVGAVFMREMWLVLRDPFSLIFSLVQPLVFLGLFGPLLAGSVS